ncbi:cytochrome P450 [Novosphingobium cyanobacteriorum]|uniref:Cytochrome P450 n=1 Tax=Novosphingobium cyanobacteriorum TaxID=3024215 RepID=A0ABT6CM24_9SPHN|nr:cytochrome P450 [Novosphingobium cyanobacteriorum]MDF8334579.1 cytochrome P450 [Novosphingobium cyanobacteriorum]
MESARIPAHVPEHLVRDFDIFTFVGEDEDAHRAWHDQVNNGPDLFFTPHSGGFWVINNADLLEAALPDWELFSSAQGIGIPPSPAEIPPMLPIEADDPYHKALRRPLNLALSPKGVVELAKSARELTVGLIDTIAPQGKCEFVHDFSLKMPMELFLRIVDIPSNDREYLIGLANTAIKGTVDQERFRAMGAMNAYLSEWIDRRVALPGTDLMSAIVNMDVDGRPLTKAEQVGYMTTVMLGGLDTVGGMMALTTRHMALNPGHRRYLRNHPDVIPDAIEEILRRYAISTVARYVTRDSTFGGIDLKEGDRIMLPTPLHGVDETRWDNALEVRLDRKPRDHMAFGKGTHRCPGAILARAELRIFLEEWLRRIPDFTIDESRGGVKWETGAVLGLKALPLVWNAS